MFARREISLKVNKTPRRKGADEDEREPMTPEELHKAIHTEMRYVALYIAGGYILKRVLDTASEIAIIAAKAKVG